MKKSLLILTMLFAGVANVLAQQFSEEQRQEFFLRAAERTAKQIKIADENEEWFMQTYITYLMAMAEVQEMHPVARQKVETPEAMLADIENSFKRSEAEVKVKRTFLAVFSEKLSPEQLHQIFVPKRNARFGRGAAPGHRPMRGGGEGPGFERPGGDF